MPIVKPNNNRTSGISALVLFVALTFSSSVHGADFLIRDGETRTTTQVVDDGDTGTIEEGGAIKTNGDDGIFGLSTNNVSINNYGLIRTFDDDSDGMRLNGSTTDFILNNYGSIRTFGSNSNGVHFRNNTDDILINNFGSIETGSATADDSHGIYLDDGVADVIINNYGSIKTNGTNSDGIRLENATGNTINNYRSGSISVNGSGSHAILICDISGSEFNIINNYGGVFATGQADTAIADHLGNFNNTLNLFPGTRIVGLIDFRQPGDVINIFGNGGAGSSSTLMFEALQVPPTINTIGNHVFNVGGPTGTYFFVDPTGQSVGGVSLASLTGGIHGVIDRVLRQGHNPNPTQLASTRVEPGMMSQEKGSQVWVSGFGSHRNRRDDDQQVLGYDHDYYGGVAGYEMTIGSMRVGAMAGYARSDFATDFVSIQTDSDSYFGGAYAQMKLGKWFDLGFTLLAGYEDIDNDRLVVDNINGFETAEADFDSFFLSPSITLSAPLKVSNKTEIRPSLSGSYSVGFQDGYTETGTTQSNMTVEDRTVHAFIGRAQISVAHRFTNRIDTETRIGFQARHTDNGIVDMTLAGTSFTFPTAGDDTVLGGFFGANIGYRVTDRLNVNLDGEYTMSEGDETNITGQLGAEFTF